MPDTETLQRWLKTANAIVDESRTLILKSVRDGFEHRLKENDTYIVVEADKNVGPCIIEREEYIKRAILDHLGNERNYKRISARCADSLQ